MHDVPDRRDSSLGARSAANALFEAFEKDHRELTQGLRELLLAVRRGAFFEARQKADLLDRIAGPHIKFEEEVFYPCLEPKLGSAFISRLDAEHDAGRRAIEKLLDVAIAKPRSEGGQPLPVVEEIEGLLEVALEHALSCGTLLSHLESLGDEQLLAMTETLASMKLDGSRWTDRPAATSAAETSEAASPVSS